MPILHVDMYEGRSIDQKRELVRSVTQAVCRSLDVKEDQVMIRIVETARENGARAGVLRSDSNGGSSNA